MKRILIADDDRDGADTLAKLLELEGFDVHVAYDGQSTILAAGQFQPDAIILDLMMPKLDGFQVAESLRQLPAFKDKMFIALTGFSDQQYLDKASNCRFDEYLIKPVKLNLLLEVLREVHS